MWNGDGRGWMTTGIARVQREAGGSVRRGGPVVMSWWARCACPVLGSAPPGSDSPAGGRRSCSDRIDSCGPASQSCDLAIRIAHRAVAIVHERRSDRARQVLDRAAFPSASRTSGPGSRSVTLRVTPAGFVIVQHAFRVAHAGFEIVQPGPSRRARQVRDRARRPFASQARRSDRARWVRDRALAPLPYPPELGRLAPRLGALCCNAFSSNVLRFS
jgi:hypothetical protein